MAKSTSFAAEISGAKELSEQLDKLVKEMSDELSPAVEAGIEPVLQAAKRKAPVGDMHKESRRALRTNLATRETEGRKHAILRDSLVKKRVKTKDGTAAWVVSTGKARHGIQVELGHNVVKDGRVVGHAPAKPYLRPAFEETKDRAEEIVRDGLGRTIDGVTRG